ncbi:MAG: hypothetical protein JOS17DRAFT_755797 [Linnemannia elongata]|nr:MAG: hypothetical protein JOS17DRAFT_755797 [Linnemannia elongata]
MFPSLPFLLFFLSLLPFFLFFLPLTTTLLCHRCSSPAYFQAQPESLPSDQQATDQHSPLHSPFTPTTPYCLSTARLVPSFIPLTSPLLKHRHHTHTFGFHFLLFTLQDHLHSHPYPKKTTRAYSSHLFAHLLPT